MKYYLAVLKNYATFSSRASRSEFCNILLFNIIILFLLIRVEENSDSHILSSIY